MVSDQSVPQVSNRVKMLIKNMLDNRSKGWEKTKKQDESGPMKVEELREKVEKKLREEMAQREQAEMEEQGYLGGRRGDDRGGKYGKQGTYKEKDGRGPKGGRDDRKGGKYEK
jgi:hypothetical protein